MVYKIDAQRDRQYIEEFRAQPIGAHSPGLQRLLNVMRNDTTGYQIVLICRKPFAEWVLGTNRSKSAPSATGRKAPATKAHSRATLPHLCAGETR